MAERLKESDFVIYTFHRSSTQDKSEAATTTARDGRQDAKKSMIGGHGRYGHALT